MNARACLSSRARDGATKTLRAAVSAAATITLLLGGAPARAEAVAGSPIEVGGAIRFNVYERSWIDEGRTKDYWAFDTAMLNLGFESGAWDGSAQYRIYYYSDAKQVTHFPHHVWVGYQLDPARKVQVGLQKVPFGPLPFASHNYFFSLGYYVGLEDDYDPGLVYRETHGPWDVQVGYFPTDEGNGFGESEDSARYSYDVVNGFNVNNSERHHVSLRGAYTFTHDTAHATEVGASGLYGQIPNGDTGRTGERVAASMHLDGSYGPWGVKAQIAYYRFALENPAGEDDRVVVMGAYDIPYKVAAEAMLYSISVSRTWTMNGETLETVTLYNDYSYLAKAEDAFPDTQHNVLGVSLDFQGPLFMFVDYALGRHNAWIGPDFTNGLGSGNPHDDWEHRLNINVGIYF